MTVSYPDRVYAAGKTAWQWVPTIANVAALKATEYTAGIATQCSYEADQMAYDLSADSTEAQRYCDKYASQTPGQRKLDFGTVDVYVDPQKPTDAAYALATAWKLEPTGYMVLRAGVPTATAAAAAQVATAVVKVKVVSLGMVPPDPTNAGDFYKWRFQLLTQGDPVFDVVMAA